MAVFGILLVNVNQLFEPVWIANSPLGLVRDQSLAGVLWFLSDALVSDKFLALFSLLFGAGFTLQWSRTGDDDRQFRDIYRHRLTWLAFFGLLHALFLYFADVLFIYAMAGALLFLMRRWPGRRLLVAGIALWTLTLLWQAAFVSLIACWYGFGLYGELTRAQQLALACMLFVMEVALSRLWLSRYRMGPLEWIWRQLTYRRALELRRAAAG